MKFTTVLAMILATALILVMIPFSVSAADPVCFVSDTGSDTNDGASAANPKASLNGAYEALLSGGTIVICGPLTVSTYADGTTYSTPASESTFTITTKWDGTDYAETNGAYLGVDCWIYFNAPHILRDLKIAVMKNTQLFCANGNKFLVDTGVECVQQGATNYIGLTAGRNNDEIVLDKDHGGDLTVNSGTWQMIRGGTRNTTNVNAVTEGDTVVTLNGGEYYDIIYGAGGGQHNGNVTLNINGGTFYKDIRFCEGGKCAVAGNVTINVTGGDFTLIPKISAFTGATTVVSGTVSFNISGGTFQDYSILTGDTTPDHMHSPNELVLDISKWQNPNMVLISAAEGFDKILLGEGVELITTAAPETTAAPVTSPTESTSADSGDPTMTVALVAASVVVCAAVIVILRRKITF